MENPPAKVKKQYAKVKRAIIDLHVALDLLNDMIIDQKDNNEIG
jgi:hypothetical protein